MTERNVDETEKKSPSMFRKYERQIPWRKQIMYSASIMVLLSLLIDWARIPNPNMILISAVVVLSVLFGKEGGITSAVIMSLYALFFFSENNNFVSFSKDSLFSLIVTEISILVITVFLCMLKDREIKAYDELEDLAVFLKAENDILENESATDELTKVKNRLSLRKDYTGYIGKPLLVMMMDLDYFKEINDTYGHMTGDEVLVGLSAILKEQFTEKYVYRYGGDEFLIIMPDTDPEAFKDKVYAMKDMVKQIQTSAGIQPTFSAGYVYGETERNEDLRNMIRKSDEVLYRAKEAGKNRIMSEPMISEE